MDRKSRAPRGDWRNFDKSALPLAPQLAVNRNPYSGMNTSGYGNASIASNGYNEHNNSNTTLNSINPNGDLSVDNIDKAKVHRRFSMRLNAPPQLDYQNQPLPMNAQSMVHKSNQKSGVNGNGVTGGRRRLSTTQLLPHPMSQQLQYGKYSSIGNLYGDELSQLSQKNFDAKSFIRENLSNSTATKINEFANSLSKLSIELDDNIKEVINRSLDSILKTSKDFNETESEVKILKNLFNELNETLQILKETADLRLSKEMNSTSKRDRSSIMVVQKLWDKELQSLFNHVAGAQQLITAIPGRHILAESGKWIEFSPTTMKSLQMVHLFVLNDHFLVLTKRRLNDNNSGRSKTQNLVAIQCWPLKDIKLFDMKLANSSSDVHTIKILYQSNQFYYRTERDDHYMKVLNAYRRGKDEIRTVLENDRVMNQNDRKSEKLNGRSVNKERRSSGILHTSHQKSRSLELFSNDTVNAMKTLDDNIDELDIRISRKNYGELVVLLKVIESELNKLGNKKIDLEVEEIVQIIENLKLRLRSRRKVIVDSLTENFNTQSINSVADIEEIIRLLHALNLPDVARDKFLESRDLLISNLIDKVEINGVIPDFITQISIIRFQIIKSTIKIYQSCFKGDDQSCFLVDWCFDQVKLHVNFLKQQLNGVNMSSSNYLDCVRVTKEQVNDLRDLGVDVGFLLEGFYKSVEGSKL